MTACTVAACILALAGPVATVDGSTPYVTMIAMPDGYAIRFDNARVATTSPDDFLLSLDGLDVAVHVASQIGDDPDDMIVTPPPGWWCSPCAVTVRENQSGVVMLWPVALS